MFPYFKFIFLLFIFIWSTTAQNTDEITRKHHQVLLKSLDDSKLEESYKYLERKILEALEAEDYFSVVNDMHILILYQLRIGLYFESEQMAIEALEYLEKLPESNEKTRGLLYIYSDLGRIYRGYESYENAIFFYKNSLKVAPREKDSLKIINNIGNIYLDQNDYVNAQKYFEDAYNMALNYPETYVVATALDNWGYAKAMEGSEDGVNRMMEAFKIRNEANDQSGVYSSFRHLAQYYYLNNNKKEALDYAQKAYVVAKQIGSPAYVENALINLLKMKNDSISQEFIQIRDSIDSDRLRQQNRYAAIKYNVAKERENTARIKFLQEKEKRRRMIVQFSSLFIIGIGFGYFFFQRIQNRKKIAENILNTEARISQRVHDEVANDIYRLMMRIQNNSSEEEAVLDDLENIYNRTRDISRETAQIIVQGDFSKQLQDLIDNFRGDNINIIVKNLSNIDWKKLPNIKKGNVYRAIQELLINMKKHSKANVVALVFSQQSKNIEIKYSDNGIGYQAIKKNGLQNTENRIKAISGSFTFDSELGRGFRATIKV